MRHAPVREGHLAGEDEICRLGCRFVPALCPNLRYLDGAELDSLPVAQFVKTIGREQNAISRDELHDVPSVSGTREHSRRQATLA